MSEQRGSAKKSEVRRTAARNPPNQHCGENWQRPTQILAVTLIRHARVVALLDEQTNDRAHLCPPLERGTRDCSGTGPATSRILDLRAPLSDADLSDPTKGRSAAKPAGASK